MKLQSLPTPVAPAQLRRLLDHFKTLGADVWEESPYIKTVYTPKGVKIMSAARVQPRGSWHVMCVPGLITGTKHVMPD